MKKLLLLLAFSAQLQAIEIEGLPSRLTGDFERWDGPQSLHPVPEARPFNSPIQRFNNGAYGVDAPTNPIRPYDAPPARLLRDEASDRRWK